MGRHAVWQRINARSLDKKVYGRIIRAYRHGEYHEVLLLHRKTVSRRHPKYKSYGQWAVIDGTTVVHRKSYWFKAINQAPTTWANEVLGLHLDGTYARQRTQQAEAQEAYLRELEESRAAARVRPADSEDESPEGRLDRFLHECYERNIGPLDDPKWDDGVDGEAGEEPQVKRPEVSLPPPTRSSDLVDHRPKHRRTVVNYDLPAALDELPTKHFCQRTRKTNHLLRNLRRRRRRRDLPMVLPIMPCSAITGMPTLLDKLDESLKRLEQPAQLDP